MVRHDGADEPVGDELAQGVGDLSVDQPNSARMYDYFLGGAANFAVDRTAAEQLTALIPDTETWAQANRSFLGRAVTDLCHRGIDQFLDLGSGVPTKGNVHEIAHRHNPAARIAYVDYDAVAVHHAGRLLDEAEDRVTVTQADISDPARVLAAPGVGGLLDFTRPVAVLAVALLHFIPDAQDPAGVLAAYRQACVSKSALVVSHMSQVTLTDEQVGGVYGTYADTPTPVTWRSPTAIEQLLAGYQLVQPGLVLLDHWRPDTPVSTAQAAAANSYGAVGLLP